MPRLLYIVSIVSALIGVGVRVWWTHGMNQERTPDTLNAQYDYIIGKMRMDRKIRIVVTVGAGSAGSVLAARLSADPTLTVLVIEAGPHEYSLPYTHVPGVVPFLQQTHIDWAYKTVAQNQSTLGMNGQVFVVFNQCIHPLLSNHNGRAVVCWAAQAYSTQCWRIVAMHATIIGGSVRTIVGIDTFLAAECELGIGFL
jgi:hypothetical protein